MLQNISVWGIRSPQSLWITQQIISWFLVSRSLTLTPLAFPAGPVRVQNCPVSVLAAPHPSEAVLSIWPATGTLHHTGSISRGGQALRSENASFVVDTLPCAHNSPYLLPSGAETFTLSSMHHAVRTSACCLRSWWLEVRLSPAWRSWCCGLGFRANRATKGNPSQLFVSEWERELFMF